MSKPHLIAKIGYVGHEWTWVPTVKELSFTQKSLEFFCGDKYKVMCYHPGIEVQVPEEHKDDFTIIEVTSLDEFRKLIIHPVK